MSLVHVKSNTIGNATGTVSVWNTQGSSTTVAASALVQPQDWNSAHQLTQLFGGNTLGSSSVSGTDLLWAAGNNITLSASQGASIATVTIQGPPNLSTWMPREPASSTLAVYWGVNTASQSQVFVPFNVPAQLQLDCMRVWVQASFLSTTNAYSQSISHQFGLYSNNAGTLSQISTGSYSIGHSGSSVSGTLSYPASSNSAGYTYSTTTYTGTALANSLFGSAALKAVDLVFGGNMTLTQGQYWLNQLMRGSSAGVNNVGFQSIQLMCNAMNTLFLQPSAIGQTVLSGTNPLAPYQGMASPVGTTGALSATVALSAVTLKGFNSNNIPLLACLST
jgi:hypothetical protein